MKSQIRYNTKLQVYLTQMLIYLIDNHKMTYEDFNELIEISPSEFSNTIKTFKEMLIDLKMHMSLYTETTNPNYLNDMKFNIKAYYLQVIGYNYKFEYMDLSDKKRIRYSMPIVYLMLKNHHYITTKELSNIFPNFNRNVMMNLMSKLKDIVSEDIIKNEINSYVLEEE